MKLHAEVDAPTESTPRRTAVAVEREDERCDTSNRLPGSPEVPQLGAGVGATGVVVAGQT